MTISSFFANIISSLLLSLLFYMIHSCSQHMSSTTMFLWLSEQLSFNSIDNSLHRIWTFIKSDSFWTSHMECFTRQFFDFLICVPLHCFKLSYNFRDCCVCIPHQRYCYLHVYIFSFSLVYRYVIVCQTSCINKCTRPTYHVFYSLTRTAGSSMLEYMLFIYPSESHHFHSPQLLWDIFITMVSSDRNFISLHLVIVQND